MDCLDSKIPEWFIPFDKNQITRRKRNLPHWEQSAGTYFLTFRLADSIAKETQVKWRGIKKEFFNLHPKPWDQDTYEKYRSEISEKMESLLDQGYGSCLLKNSKIREIVFDSLLYYNEERYHLDCFVIMPNHVHVLLYPIHPATLTSIQQNWKSYTSHIICRNEGVKPPFWLDEGWDRLVRSLGKFLETRSYIISNPAKANLSKDEYEIWMQPSYAT